MQGDLWDYYRLFSLFRLNLVAAHARSVHTLHLLGPVTLPVIFWGTISLLLTMGQNPDPQMVMSEAPRDV
jgi:hypothetical protein